MQCIQGNMKRKKESNHVTLISGFNTELNTFKAEAAIMHY